MKKVSVLCMIMVFVSMFLKEVGADFNDLYAVTIVPTLLLLIFSIYFYARGMQRNISVICFLISIFFMAGKFDYEIFYRSLEKSAGMVSIFAVLPLLTFPIENGKYSEAINDYMKKFKKRNNGIFVILVIFHLILTIILNIPAMTIIQEVIKNNKFSKNYLTRLYTAGYSFYMVFSPYDGIVNMILLMAGVRYYEYFLYALSMGIFIIFLSLVLLKTNDRDSKKVFENSGTQDSEKISSKSKMKIYQLSVNIFILILITVCCSYVLKSLNNMFVTSFIILCYSLIWSFQTCTFDEYKMQFKNYVEKVTKFGNILVFLISTNCLGEILKYTSLSVFMEKQFLKIMILPEYFIIEILIVITVLLSLTGVHMIIPITSMAMIIKPEFLNISSPAFVLLLLVCWISGMSISPFVPFTAMVADTIDEKITNVTFKHNKWYVILVMLAAPMIILILNKLLA